MLWPSGALVWQSSPGSRAHQSDSLGASTWAGSSWGTWAMSVAVGEAPEHDALMLAPCRWGFLAAHNEPPSPSRRTGRRRSGGVEATTALSDRGFSDAAWPQAQHRQNRSLAGAGCAFQDFVLQ